MTLSKKNINLEKKQALKRISKQIKFEKEKQAEKNSNTNELILKNTELYIPMTYEKICNLNKKKYRDLKIKILKNNLSQCMFYLKESIEGYKELYNKTEFWEEKSTYKFNFQDWFVFKKANGKLTRYFNDIKKIAQKIGVIENGND